MSLQSVRSVTPELVCAAMDINDPEWVAEIRWRIERNRHLCVQEHSIHRDPETDEYWLTCDTKPEPQEIGRRSFNVLDYAAHHEHLQMFLEKTLAQHTTMVANQIVGTLLDCLQV